MSLWTIEVFTDPSSCADRIGSYLGLEKPTAPSYGAVQDGFRDVDVEQLELNSQADQATAGPDGMQGPRGTQGTGSGPAIP
jgi:hypothetical protein